MKPGQESAVNYFQNKALTMTHYLLAVAILLYSNIAFSQKTAITGEWMEVGVARIDITPEGPIRLAGYGIRKKTESEGVLQRLSAKALAFGSDAQGLSILITVDLVGIPGHITTKLAERLSDKIGIESRQLFSHLNSFQNIP